MRSHSVGRPLSGVLLASMIALCPAPAAAGDHGPARVAAPAPASVQGGPQATWSGASPFEDAFTRAYGWLCEKAGIVPTDFGDRNGVAATGVSRAHGNRGERGSDRD